MPELPEIECIRRGLEGPLSGRTITVVSISREDVVHPQSNATPDQLLLAGRVMSLRRHGKQLAVLVEGGRCLVVQLGMTGQLLLNPGGSSMPADHVHVVWTLDDGSNLSFRDPRRFGCLTPLCSTSSLEDRWNALGPDALLSKPAFVRSRLMHGRRRVKSALLDQSTIAGVGNIYADEALHSAGIAPMKPIEELSEKQRRSLVHHLRVHLRGAIGQGGTTISDYRSVDGSKGGWGTRRKVHGRRGLPCLVCGLALVGDVVGGRTTVWCTRCQP